MAKVRRFTTQFDPTEDRIRLAVEFDTDAVEVLWLTRRLANRLAQALDVVSAPVL